MTKNPFMITSRQLSQQRFEIKNKIELGLYTSSKKKTYDTIMYLGLTTLLNEYFKLRYQDDQINNAASRSAVRVEWLNTEYARLKEGAELFSNCEVLPSEDITHQLDLFSRQS